MARTRLRCWRTGPASVSWRVLSHDPLEAFHHSDVMLLDLVRGEQADLVLLGSRGRSRLQGLRAWSTAP